MTDIILRKATFDDIEVAYRIKKASFKTYVEKVWSWDEIEQRKIYERRFVEQEFKIIQVSETDVGFLSLVQDDKFLKVKQIFILPKFQGIGIGKKCLENIIIDAKKNSCSIRLRVLKVNKGAIAFYCRLGFNKISENNTHIMFGKKP